MKYLIFFAIVLFVWSCKESTGSKSGMDLQDVFEHPPITVQSVAKSYKSNVVAEAINDMEETILCMSMKVDDQETTYFIQPDKVELEELSYRYQDADVVDMKSALLFSDPATGKKTLIYLPGRFPIDSMDLKPDVTIPVLGITRYQSTLEKITSRWTQIVCKCVDMTENTVIYKDRTISECDTGGVGSNECSLAIKESVATCQTVCKSGATACCWFEF